jgi:hypothetical protein
MRLNPSKRSRADGEVPLVIPLHRVGSNDVSLVGGKAASLAVLMRASLPVPAGFCVTAAACRQFLDSCPMRKDLLRTLSQISEAEPDQTARLSERALECLDQAAVPHAVEQAVLKAWRAHGVERAYAVRSSATVEDAADHSFAGQFESFLNIRAQDAPVAAVRKCWLSLFSERALAYHARNGLPVAQSAMAVVVQEMVPAEVAGVLFTIDPTTGDTNRIVIESAPGLGETVVGGRVVPDRMVLAKPSLTIVSRTAGGNTTANAKILDDSVVQRLAILSRRVEGAMTGPLDIAWAMCGGAIYLLQARPATGRRLVKTWGERQIWTNGNSGEAVPDALTPMTYSVLMPFLQGLCDNLMGHLGFRIQVEHLLSLIAGRPYFNVNLGAALLRYAPGIKPEDIGEIFGGAHEPMVRKGLIQLKAEDLPHLQFHPWQMICGMPPVLVAMMRFLFLKGPQAVHALPLSPGPSGVTAFENYSDEALLESIRAALPTQQTGRHPALRFMGIGAFCLVAFFALSKRWFGAEGPALAGRLTAGLGTLDPAEAGRDLWRLAEFVQEHAQVRRAVEEEHSFTALERQLSTLDAGKAFLVRWHALLARHGHHARGELELMNPRWCETPDVVLALVRNYLEAIVRNLAVPETRLAELAEQRAALERECLRRLKNPCKRVLFRRALDCARRGVAIKENVKSDLVEGICRARLLLLELGCRLAERGRCADRNDVFFLKLEELRSDFLFGTGPGLRETTAPRRTEYDRNQNLNPPPVVFGTGDPSTWQTKSSLPAMQHLEGLAVSPGVATGRARVILKPNSQDLHTRKISSS